MLKMIRPLLTVIFGIILVFSYLRYIERHTLFHPMKEIHYTPDSYGLPFQDIYFKTSDGVLLNGWLVPKKDSRYTVIFSHGNAGNISHRIEKTQFFNELGCSVFVFDYRGYGKSKGAPSEKGLYLDTQAAYDYLLSMGIKPEGIIGYGESLGGSAIVNLAYHNKLSALIVDSAISSERDLVDAVYPFIPYWIFASRLDSVSRIKSIAVPKLIIHSVNDEIVPYSMGKRLYANAAPPKEFLEIRGSHNSCFFECKPQIKEKVAAFLKNLSNL